MADDREPPPLFDDDDNAEEKQENGDLFSSVNEVSYREGLVLECMHRNNLFVHLSTRRHQFIAAGQRRASQGGDFQGGGNFLWQILNHNVIFK